MAKRTSNPFDLAVGCGLAGMHSAITLWYRWPMIAAAYTSSGDGKHGPEMARMVSEKAAAMIEGVFDAQKEMLRLTDAAVSGRLDLADLASAPSSIAEAGLRPAFRAVKANSRRLSRAR